MEDIDVWRSAHHMMKRYGDDAAVTGLHGMAVRLTPANECRCFLFEGLRLR